MPSDSRHSSDGHTYQMAGAKVDEAGPRKKTTQGCLHKQCNINLNFIYFIHLLISIHVNQHIIYN